MTDRTKGGERAACANCHHRIVTDTCTVYRYQGTWHCKHWRDGT